MNHLKAVAKADLEPRFAPVIANHAEWIETLPGEKLAFHVRNEQVGGAYAIMETIAQPGIAAPMHYHAQDEIFHVLDGRTTFSVAGEVFEAGPGTTVVIPAGTHHTWKNRTDEPIRMLAFFAPGGIEPMFERMAGLSPEALGAMAAEFGTIIVGPPLE